MCAVITTAAMLLERPPVPGSFAPHPSAPLTWALKADFHPVSPCQISAALKAQRSQHLAAPAVPSTPHILFPWELTWETRPAQQGLSVHGVS